ncbi:substrate-binding periplasmic protein [Zavarzinia sp. CC-PAN008]|uniref:substrate-binding periplasmic protein n=1 Tax=Zavarzinia sp. CC-PAN008 TaxID=3243332 RepID=UPI003F7442D4
MGVIKTAILATGMAVIGMATAQAACLQEIKDKGTLLVGNGLMGLKPFAYKNETTGAYEGFEPEIIAELAKRLEIPQWDYVVTEWTTLIPGLGAKRWDIILSGMSATQERQTNGNMLFSRPYVVLYDRIIVLKDSPVQSLADLKGKTVASTLGSLDSLNAHVLAEAGEVGQVMDFNTFSEPFLALRNKQADAVVMDQITLQSELEQGGDLRAIGEPIPYRAKPEFVEAESKAPYILGGVAAGARAECTDLIEAINTALIAMEQDGTREKILTKYELWSPEQMKVMKE